MKIRHSLTPRNEKIARLFRTVEQRTITTEEEFALGFEYQSASPERKKEIEDILLRNNLRFVISVAKHYAGTMELEDLFITGAMGLLEGIRRWDPTRGVKLISWAVNLIRKYILEEISWNSRTVRLPGHIEVVVRKIKENADAWEAKYGRLNPELIVELLGVSRETAEVALIYARYSVHSLDAKIRDEEHTLYDHIPAEPIDDGGSLSEDEEVVLLRQALSLLKRKHEDWYTIVSLYHGLDGGVNLSFRRIAERVGKSEFEVRRILKKSHDYIRRYVEQNRPRA